MECRIRWVKTGKSIIAVPKSQTSTWPTGLFRVAPFRLAILTNTYSEKCLYLYHLLLYIAELFLAKTVLYFDGLKHLQRRLLGYLFTRFKIIYYLVPEHKEKYSSFRYTFKGKTNSLTAFYFIHYSILLSMLTKCR